MLDHRNGQRVTAVLWCSPAPPRWEFVLQPVYAAARHLLAAWGTVLRSLAFQGRRVDIWAPVCHAIEAATASWNTQRHPCMWGQHRRQRSRRQAGIAVVPKVAETCRMHHLEPYLMSLSVRKESLVVSLLYPYHQPECLSNRVRFSGENPLKQYPQL